MIVNIIVTRTVHRLQMCRSRREVNNKAHIYSEVDSKGQGRQQGSRTTARVKNDTKGQGRRQRSRMIPKVKDDTEGQG